MGIFFRKYNVVNTSEKSCLAGLDVGDRCEMVGFSKSLDTAIKRRLLELGIVPGKVVVLEQISFLGDVLLIQINGYMLSLRKSIALQINVIKK